MKVFMCRQLRVMLNSFERLQVAAQKLFPERAAKRQRHNGAGASSDPVTLTPPVSYTHLRAHETDSYL
eukprot:2748550-Pleurochrysis_carterae.AAC.1